MSDETPSFIISEAGGDGQFYAAYGRSLASWSWVEHALCGLYISLTQGSDIESRARFFFAIRGFRNKVETIDRLVAELVGKADAQLSVSALESEWKSIRRSLLHVVKDRNKLAHAGIWTSPGIGSYAHGSIWEVGSLPVAPNDREPLVITLTKMHDIGQAFETTARCIEAFAATLRAHKGKVV